MAQVVWSEPARADLEAIAEYVAFENPSAAAALLDRVLRHVDQLSRHPQSGSWLPELGRSRYRQIVEPPCRVIYRRAGNAIAILHVMRTERLLDMLRIIDAEGAPEP